MRNDPFEEEGRPACHPNFISETRQFPAFDDFEEPRLFEGHVGEDGNSAFRRCGQEPFLDLAIEDRVVELNEVEVSLLHRAQQWRQVNILVMRYPGIADMAFFLPRAQIRENDLHIDEA